VTIVEYQSKKWLSCVGQQSGYFCWSNYAFFQRITTVPNCCNNYVTL